MATATPRPRRNLDESHRRVRHPLQKLRGYIRFYVSAEGVATVMLFLALWFWIGLLLDWGVFKLLSWDWVEKLENLWGIRLSLLLVILAALTALLVFRVALRLFRDFRDSALALVLERRYPKELGDRLITAVELANTDESARYGYSTAMIEHTIHDAADRVEPLPVQQVFDWKRLIKEGLWIAVLTVGLYLLAAAAFSAPAMIQNRQASLAGAGQFNDVAAVWFERNVLLDDVLWPRRAYLELVNFPTEGDLRIPQNTEPPPVTVRAYKWVIADRKGRGGWRPLRWDDLTPALLGGEVPPSSVLPPEWATAGNPLTLDEVEWLLGQDETHKTLPGESHKPLRDVLEQLKARAESSAMSRKLRMLTIPEHVVASYRSKDTRGDIKGPKQPKNQYTIRFPVLKEPTRFWIRGEDYDTPTRNIVTVPPPSLVSPLLRDEYQPAYLYYRVPQGSGPEALKGQKQVVRDLSVPLFGGDTSRFEVPAGTDVVLRAKADKDLKDVKIRSREGSLPFKPELSRPPNDPRAFQVSIPNIRPPADRAAGDRAAVDFEVIFTDTDNINGTRNIVIKPLEDVAPDPDLQIDVVRKTSQGYLVSPKARVPFPGKVTDDRGLNTVEYVYTLSLLETDADRNARTQQMAGFLGLLLAAAPRSPQELLAGALMGRRAQAALPQAEDLARTSRRVPVASWQSELVSRRGEFVGLDEILRRLEEDINQTAQRIKTESFANNNDMTVQKILEQLEEQPPRRALLRLFKMETDDERSAFDLQDVARLDNRFKVVSVQEAQPRYKIQVWVESLDNDIETGPNRGRSKETFTLAVVPEHELLLEINKEEESLHHKAHEMFLRLRGPGSVEDKLVKVNGDLVNVAKPTEFGALIARNEELEQNLEKALDTLKEIHVDYSRILKELEFNRVQASKINHVRGRVVGPMTDIIDKDFPSTLSVMRKYKEVLTTAQPDLTNKINESRKAGEEARKELKDLCDKLHTLMSDMEEIISLAKVVQRAVLIVEQLHAQDVAYKRWHKWKLDILLESLIEKPK